RWASTRHKNSPISAAGRCSCSTTARRLPSWWVEGLSFFHHKEALRMPATPEVRIQELHLTLPPPPKPVAKYKPAVLVGNILYVSGPGRAKGEGKPDAGRVGADLTTEQGKEAARRVGLAILSTVRNTLGSLDKVKRLVKTLGMVNCTPDYKDQPLVINGFSELMAALFGEDAGVGTRSAGGMGSLPGGIPVEIECIFEVA